MQSQFQKNIQILADSAQPDRIQQIQNKGFRIQGVKKQPGSINKSINFLKTKKIYISSQCINTINQIQQYSYKKDKQTNKYTDQPIEFNNHCMDALRYSVQE